DSEHVPELPPEDTVNVATDHQKNQTDISPVDTWCNTCS
ncbi:hypothetical protein A2U01_0042589, partial [Trifolium medium]|nr:hypothetical protein [Trifolium medium]